MVVVTPSYAADHDLLVDLHESVLSCFPVSVSHLVVTPERDVNLFRPLEGPRCTVVSVPEVMPMRLWPAPFANAWLNPRKPIPPIRGWIMQQLVKLGAASQAQEQIVVLADADVTFVRKVTAETFAPGDRIRFYRKDGAVDQTLPRHIRWHAAARTLLGLPGSPEPPLPDYISALNTWDRDVVRACLGRVSEVGSRPWAELVSRFVHFSEFILYGVHRDNDPDRDLDADTDDSMCLSYWETTPLDDVSSEELGRRLSPTDVAVMISAKSGTTLPVRRRLVASLRG
ncbi:MAG TPA: DUF6492 family protein [Acidimicrobiales bacterium]|nr:DUF6492 family protein [Acidimicrobiales bacterium]